MASTYSDRLRIELMTAGDQSGTWGDTTNTNLGTLIEEAIAGVAVSEKIASDGKVKLGMKRRGVFIAYASGAVAIGSPLASAGENYVWVAKDTLSGASIIGTALETAADGESFKFVLNIAGNTN